MTLLLPISAIIPTRNRKDPFLRFLNSLAQQSAQPVEMIIIDGSINDETRSLCRARIPGLLTNLIYHQATEIGAAAQRNQGMAYASQENILFCDDDILFEDECLARLWNTLQKDDQLGGVNAMITNQRYLPPGRISRVLFRFLHGKHEGSYAGKCIGPAMNLLPEDDPALPNIVLVEWLNTTCTLYRRKALPQPPFPDLFIGYSLMEDVTLSLTVGRRWKLANVRSAKIFHDSQPGDHKNNSFVLAKMSFVNRHYVMTQVLERNHLTDYFKLLILQLFEVAASLQSAQGWAHLPSTLGGKLAALYAILFSGQFSPLPKDEKRLSL